jgi:hypothetical protein
MQLDFNDHNKVWAISQELLAKSSEYATARMEYAEAKFQYELNLAKELPFLRQKKSNIGVETAQIMILEDDKDEIKLLYCNLIMKENYYKGLEKIIDALKTQITLAQSLIRNTQGQGG